MIIDTGQGLRPGAIGEHAPWAQQSGAGARFTTPGGRPVPITVQPVTAPASYQGDCGDAPSGGAVYGVCLSGGPCTSSSPSGSPADAVYIGLNRLVPDNYWADGPDVVLSGVNFGQNVGALVNHSGTVGAAVTAQEHGVPTVALSAEVSFHDLSATPFSQTSAFAVSLLERLVAKDALTPGTALNVNFPFIEADETLGHPVLTTTGTGNDIGSNYTGEVGVEGGTYQLLVGASTDETRSRADTTALHENNIAITPLDGDWTATGAGHAFEQIVQGWRP
jgi:5'/3'-nucleotidase